MLALCQLHANSLPLHALLVHLQETSNSVLFTTPVQTQRMSKQQNRLEKLWWLVVLCLSALSVSGFVPAAARTARPTAQSPQSDSSAAPTHRRAIAAAASAAAHRRSRSSLQASSADEQPARADEAPMQTERLPMDIGFSEAMSYMAQAQPARIKIPTKAPLVGAPQQVAEKEYSIDAILKELAEIQRQGPKNYCILGTRHCTFLHQQIIELLAYALVLSGNHVFTSGAGGTNAATIRGALRAERPDLLTVVLPQSFEKQSTESQDLLEKVRVGVSLLSMLHCVCKNATVCCCL
jgi:hypothetical protein